MTTNLEETYKNVAQEITTKSNHEHPKKRPPLGLISRFELETTLGYLKEDNHLQARQRLGLLLLYLTGLRVSNLLLLTVGNCKELHEKGEVHTEKLSRPLILCMEGRSMLNERNNDIAKLTENKTNEDPIFSGRRKEMDKWKPLNRVVLNQELNEVLKKLSANLGKYIRTHSFRASLISDLLKAGVPLRTVKIIVGHRESKTTLAYDKEKPTSGTHYLRHRALASRFNSNEDPKRI